MLCIAGRQINQTNKGERTMESNYIVKIVGTRTEYRVSALTGKDAKWLVAIKILNINSISYLTARKIKN